MGALNGLEMLGPIGPNLRKMYGLTEQSIGLTLCILDYLNDNVLMD